MTISDLIGALNRRRFVASIILVASLAASAATLLTIPPDARASSTYFVLDQTSPAGASPTRTGNFLSQERVKSYAALLGGDRIANDVSRRLSGRLSPAEISNSITVDSEPDTVVITVITRDESADLAIETGIAVGQSFVALVSELERPTPTAPPLVRIQTVQPATLVPSSGWQRPVAYMLGALILGSLLAVGTAVLIDRRDETVRGSDELGRLVGYSNLATIPVESAANFSHFVETLNQGSPTSEAYRQARTNLQFTVFDRDTHVIAITSAVPGEGKSTVCCNLGAVLARGGMRVLLVDGDLRRPALANYTNLTNDVGLTNVLSDQVPFEAAIQHSPAGFDLLAAGSIPPNPSEMVGSAQMKSLLQHAGRNYDFVVVDTPPSLFVTDAAALSPSVDGIIFCVRHGRPRQQDVTGALARLREAGGHVLGTMLLAAPTSKAEARYGGYYGVVDAGRGRRREIDGTYRSAYHQRHSAIADEEGTTTQIRTTSRHGHSRKGEFNE